MDEEDFDDDQEEASTKGVISRVIWSSHLQTGKKETPEVKYMDYDNKKEAYDEVFQSSEPSIGGVGTHSQQMTVYVMTLAG